MPNQITRIALLFLALLVLGCQQREELKSELQPQSDATATVEVGETNTSEPPVTPVSSPVLQPTLESSVTAPSAVLQPTPLSTPAFPSLEISQGLLLEDSDSGCTLPCWHGLRIGDASETDVSNVFSQLLDTPTEYNFFYPPFQGDTILEFLLTTENLYGGGQAWYFYDDVPNTASGAYYLTAIFSRETQKLIAIYELANSYQLFSSPTLQDVISKLGTPDWLYVDFESAYTLNLFYIEGITVHFTLPGDYIEPNRSMICFDSEPVIEVTILSSPYVDADNNIRDPLNGIRAPGPPSDPAPYIDEELGMSSQEFVDFIFSAEPCIEITR